MEGWVDLGHSPAMQRRESNSRSQVRRPNHYSTEPIGTNKRLNVMPSLSVILNRSTALKCKTTNTRQYSFHVPFIYFWTFRIFLFFTTRVSSARSAQHFGFGLGHGQLFFFFFFFFLGHFGFFFFLAGGHGHGGQKISGFGGQPHLSWGSSSSSSPNSVSAERHRLRDLALARASPSSIAKLARLYTTPPHGNNDHQPFVYS